VLFVDPDASAADGLRRAAGVSVDACTDFATARARILSTQYDLLVANLRLEAYNALHLVYLARAAGVQTRAIVYTDTRDERLGRDVQDAGAFYETADRYVRALPSYLTRPLPARDRRSPACPDRRGTFRGSRRTADPPYASA
jgi:hypothetical protein